MHPVNQIQKWLCDSNFDVFIVPHGDRFQGEYTHPCDDRLTWLTNFSGSAGLCLVSKNQASIFVDGRYTVQAKLQVDLTKLTIEPYTNNAIQQWFDLRIKNAGRIAFDPWLVCVKQLDQWKAMCNAEVEFVPIANNPIDLFWMDQPALPDFIVKDYPLEYSGKLACDKISDLVAHLKNHKIDACIISKSDSISWLLNIRATIVPYTPVVHGFLIVYSSSEISFFTNAHDFDKGVFDHLKITIYKEDQLLDIANKLTGTVLIDPSATPVAIEQALKSDVKKIQTQDPTIISRARKNTVEQEGMRECHVKDGMAVIQFLAWLDWAVENGQQVNEMEADEKLLLFRAKQDLFMDQSFPTIAAVGDHGAIVHYRSTPKTNAVIASPAIFLLDSGAQYLDGTTDITRTVAFGEPTFIQKQMFTRVLKGHIALSMAIFPKGTCGEQLDVLARQYLWEIGCDYAHGTGHGVGTYLSVHEGPQSISKVGAKVPLEAGMVLSNEPGYYQEGEYGIRIENLVMVAEHQLLPGMLCFEALTHVPMDRKLIDTSLLTSTELQWINHYHEEIFNVFQSNINDETTKNWLVRNTAPISPH